MSKVTALTAGADGDLDSEFNGTGKVFQDFPMYYNYLYPHCAEGPDGNLYFAAYVHRSALGVGIFCLHKDGTPNVAFGTNGFVIERFGTSKLLFVQQIHFIEDGNETKILICGHDYSANNFLARFHMDGRADTAFGVNGLKMIALPKELSGSLEHAPIPLQSSDRRISGTSKLANGNIYLCGHVTTSFGIPNHAILTRLNPDYSLDTSFNGTGFVKVIYDTPDLYEVSIRDILVHNGKITVCAWLDTDTPDGRYSMLARYNVNGTIDESFAAKGFLLFKNSGINFESIVQYAEDSILLTGTENGSGVVACFNKEGQPDARFNNGEILYHHFTENRRGGFYSVAVDQEKIIVSGSIYLTHNTGLLMVARYLMNGNPDLSFGNGNGWATADFSDYRSHHSNMVIQEDGKVVVVGDAFSYENRFMPIARFLNTTG